MRRELLFCYLFFFVFLFFGCNNDSSQVNDVGEDMSAWFMISPDEAKTAALQFLNANSQGTKSVSAGEVEVQTVWRTLAFDNPVSSVTRSQSTYTEEIPVYILSLKSSIGDNAGYVVSVGDKRVQNRVIAFSDEEKWDMSELPEFESFFWENVDNYLINTLSEGEVDMCDTYEYYVHNSDNVKFVSDFLLKWGQSPSPYNDSLPACTSTTNKVAGCVAIAMGQIMAYHGKPVSGSYVHQKYGRTVNVQYDWVKMREQLSAQYISTTVGLSGVANIIAEAGYKVYMDYGCSGSGAYDINVPQAYSRMGYTSSSLVSFNLNTIVNDINNKRPVYIRGNGNRGGHAWIIEGYKKIIYDIIYGRDCPNGGTPIPPTVVGTISHDYLYFNLGWHGSSNGYYLAEPFQNWEFATFVQMIHGIKPLN